MPAGAPPGGLDRRFMLGVKIMENFGLDTSVNFQVVARDNVNGNIMIGGDNDYVGLVTDGIYSQPVEGAALPPTGNTMNSAAHNFTDRGWLVMDNLAAVFLLNAGLTLSTTITPPVPNGTGIVEYNGRIFIIHNRAVGPERDLDVSADNGATWDQNPGAYTGQGSNGRDIFTNFNQNRLLAIHNGGTTFRTTTDPTGATGTWESFPAGNANLNQNAGAISDDGEHFCVVSANGAVSTDAGLIAGANNPWQTSAAAGIGLNICQWVQALNGFFVVSFVGPHLGFIDAANPDRVIPGSYAGVAVSFLSRCSISDGEQMLIPTNGNGAMISLREIGQTGFLVN